MIATESRDDIAIVRLDRPERRNALVPELVSQLTQELRRLAASGRPIILTGTDRWFCPGADLKWLAGFRDPSLGVAELVAVHHEAIATLFELSVPVIAAVNGAVAGGGLGLALGADYCIAARGATFTAAYFRLGLTPDGGSSVFLERVLGPARAMELLLTNRRVGADEACAWGLVNDVVEDDQLIDAAVGFAAGLERVPGYTLRNARRLLDSTNLRDRLQLESVAIRTASRGAFFREALEAFTRAHPD